METSIRPAVACDTVSAATDVGFSKFGKYCSETVTALVLAPGKKGNLKKCPTITIEKNSQSVVLKKSDVLQELWHHAGFRMKTLK